MASAICSQVGRRTLYPGLDGSVDPTVKISGAVFGVFLFATAAPPGAGWPSASAAAALGGRQVRRLVRLSPPGDTSHIDRGGVVLPQPESARRRGVPAGGGDEPAHRPEPVGRHVVVDG